MRTKRVELAAGNNAMWCDTICRINGVPGEFRPPIWLNRGPVPRYYPNAVTLTDSSDSVRQIAAVRELSATTSTALSVKDSFQCLDLEPLGFEPLFDATWIWHDAITSEERANSVDERWAIVQAPEHLTLWENAWAGESETVERPAGARIFLPALLTDPDVCFMCAFQDGRIAAGAIANRTGDIVGLSNQFAGTEPDATHWVGLLATIGAIFPGLPIVGYAHGVQLELAAYVGFETIGPLRVWAQTDPYS